jgi:hypothetical protein
LILTAFESNQAEACSIMLSVLVCVPLLLTSPASLMLPTQAEVQGYVAYCI